MTDPGLRHAALLQPATAASPRHSEAAMLDLTDGRILLAWSHFYGGASDWSAARIDGCISSDGGRTWGAPFTLQENLGQMCTYCPSLLRLASGAIGLTFFVKHSEADNRIFWRTSPDDGQTWTEPVCLTPEVRYHIIINDRTIQRRNGRIVAPISYVPAPQYTHGAKIWSFCCYSDDGGQTWQRSATEIALPKRGAMEPGIVERKDGSLLMFIRTQLGSQYRATSHDGGATWGDVRRLGPVSSEAPAQIKRIPQTGDLLMVWNHVYDPFRRHWGRTPLTAAISRDDGETWQHLRDIERDPDHFFAYPSIHFRGDEALLTYWRQPVGTATFGLQLKILALDWFYEAKDD